MLDHLAQHGTGENVTIKPLSFSWTALTLNGPRARIVLGACTEADLSNAGFRWLTGQEITVAGHKVWALRMCYGCELGWELHMPFAACLDVYNALWATGELTNEVTLPAANVMRVARLDKEYLGADETRKSASGKLPWICTYVEIEPDSVCGGHSGEALMLDKKVVGLTVSVAYGHTVGRILAFAYLMPHAAVPDTALDVVIAGQLRRARVLGQAAYDPLSEKPRTDAHVAEQECV